ncbi:MAG: tetratricopeptide repeat protein [Oscillospiraceae bacterium]|jgi:tetratricopeptide (TPR) repeat protein|nr:tetratricopeptide repeat protein [Oscillospiraceae bacterium]
MKRTCATALILVLTLAVALYGCGKKSKAPVTAAEWLDLGRKYLNDLDFEQAVVAFDNVIRIEPKNPDAYIGLADAYAGLGDTDKAAAALREGLANADSTRRIEDRLAEIEGGGAAYGPVTITMNGETSEQEYVPEWYNWRPEWPERAD